MKIGGNSNEKYEQRSHTCFLGKYGGLSLYDIDIERRYIIDYEDITFVKKYGYVLIVNPENPDGTSTDHEYIFFYSDLFGRILETDQNSDILLKVINIAMSLQ